MKLHWRLGVALIPAILFCCVAAHGIVTPPAILFSVAPVSGPAGSNLTWTYTISNDSSDYKLDFLAPLFLIGSYNYPDFGTYPASNTIDTTSFDYVGGVLAPNTGVLAPNTEWTFGTLASVHLFQSFSGTVMLPAQIQDSAGNPYASGDYSVNGILFEARLDLGTDSNGLAMLSAPYSATVEGGNPVPEPGSLILLGTGLTGLASWIRRRAKRAQDQ